MSDTSCLPTATPESVGLSGRQLRQAMDVLSGEVEAGGIPGAVFGIARHGKLAWLEAVGFRDKDPSDAMRTDAIFPLASMTKPIVSVAAMILVERGKLFLADPGGGVSAAIRRHAGRGRGPRFPHRHGADGVGTGIERDHCRGSAAPYRRHGQCRSATPSRR